nr:hypothetical protein CFP56_35142 [Quercus suber]
MEQRMWRKTFSKIIKVAVVLAVLIFNCKPVASIRAPPLAVMNSTERKSYPRYRGPVPPSKPNPRRAIVLAEVGFTRPRGQTSRADVRLSALEPEKKKEPKASSVVCDLCWLVDVQEIDGCRRSFCGVGLVFHRRIIVIYNLQ